MVGHRGGAMARIALCAWVTRAQIATGELRVVRCICDLVNRCDFDDFQQVEFVFWVFFTLHDQHVLEALVVSTTVKCLTVAQAVEFKVFQRFSNRTWVERPSACNRVRIQQCLHVSCVRSLRWREAVFCAEGACKGFRAFVLQRPVPVLSLIHI